MHEDLERLEAYVHSLWARKEFPIIEEIDGCYNHMAATAADAILQANQKYDTNVAPRTKRILDKYPEATTTSATLKILESVPATEFLNWRGLDRADRFVALLKLFQTNRIETEDDLNKRFTDDSDAFSRQLLAQNGIGPKTVDYLKILAGLQTSAIDRHLENFLIEAGISDRTYGKYEKTQNLINAAADQLGIPQAIFDHSIWHYMKEKAKPSSPPVCKKLHQQDGK
jgi:endonuclease III